MKRSLAIAALLLSTACLAGSNPICPIDDYEMYFTGRTKLVQGTLLAEYRCPGGHTTWARY